MANGKVHVAVGRGAGVATAGIAARNEDAQVIFLRALGGFFGGDLGGRMPDLLDPPCNGPNHRSVAHGLIPLGSTMVWGKDSFVRLRDFLKQKALEFSRQESFLMAALCQICIGIVDGFLAGYASHLALDAVTPMGLPIVA